MGKLVQMVYQHPYTAGGAAVWVFNLMVLRMPPPDAKSGKFYQWVFGVLHGISGAVPRIASNFLPPTSFLYKLLAGGNGEVAPVAPVPPPPPPEHTAT